MSEQGQGQHGAPPAGQSVTGAQSLIMALEAAGVDTIFGIPGGAIHEGYWKLIEFFEDDSAELYNLRTDLGEARNIAPDHPDKVRALRAKLAAWRQATGAQMPNPNPGAKKT